MIRELISRQPMLRFLFKLILCALLALGAGFAYLAVRSGDAAYTFFEWVSPARFQRYDSLFQSTAATRGLDPMLVKAVAWTESRFDPEKFGSKGERGLMQVSERAANEWARENKIDNFRVEELFDSKKNVEAGTWYLQRAWQHWEQEPDPLPFALAEYNAGASRALRWAGGEQAPPMSAKDFLANVDYPGTRKYVESIIARYQFYKRRGRM
jgi:soluble lytic murein transglycosylase